MQKNFSKYRYKNNPKSSTTILFGCCDIGETNALLPIINHLGPQNDYLIEIIAKSPAVQKLKDLISIEKTQTPNLIITGYSKDSKIEFTLLHQAKAEKIPVLLIEDFPGNFIRYKKFFRENNFFPTFICAFDELGKNLEVTSLNIPNEQVIVTGQPAFDTLITEQTAKLNKNIRKRLAIDQEIKIITFFGTANDLNAPTLTKLVASLPKNKEYIFSYRPHPQDNNNLDKLFPNIKSKLLYNSQLSTDELNIISDLVISINSTEGIRALYRNKPTIQLQLTDILDKYPEIDLLPPADIVEKKAIKVTTQTKLESAINKFLNQNTIQKESTYHNKPALPEILSIIKRILNT